MDKILIAEDDGSTRFLVEEILKEAGYAVDSVRTVRMGWDGLRPGGFGIKMVQTMVDELLYNESHNEVVFVKYLDSQD